jgi:poly(3-hydroxybutyrate) depolymerase
MGSPTRKAALATLLLGAALAAATPAEAEAPRAKAAKPAPLAGASYDYAYDGKDKGHPERAWLGRVHVPPAVATDPAKPRPLLVFLHGLNSELIQHRWFGGGAEGDVRRIVEGLVERGDVPPMIAAAPSSIVPSAVAVAGSSWPGFDLDGFLDRTEARLQGVATIDRARVIVAGHSGAGCNDKGGVAAAVRASAPVFAALAIDTCLMPSLATSLTKPQPGAHVIVAYQPLTWQKRPFAAFRKAFEREVLASPPPAGVLRELDETHPRAPMPHDAMVGLALEKWLPRLLGSGAPAAP